MSKGLVLVTGANGYIAGRTVEAFLKAGFRVRGTVRSLSSADGLKAALSSYGDALEIVEVPDIVAAGAFDEAVKGATAVAHLASPVSLNFTDPEPVIRGAVGGTVAVLESAAKEPSVAHFVLLASIASILREVDEGQPLTLTEADWNDFAERVVSENGKNAPGPAIYAASKTAGEKAFWKFRQERKPRFTMTAINPCFVSGPPMVTLTSPKQVSETIEMIWNVFRGVPLEDAGGVSGTAGYVDVRDVARLVLFGVEHPETADGQRYIAAAGWASPQDAADVLRKAYPQRRGIIDEGKPGSGFAPSYAFQPTRVFDASKSVKATGQNYIPFDRMVLDTAKAFEGLV